MPWLGSLPAVDLANTVVFTPPEELDLLTTEHELGTWAAAEMGRIPDVGATSGRLREVRELRQHLRRALFATAEGRRAPPEAVEAINAYSAAAPTYSVLREGGRAEVVATADPFARFRGTVARSAIEILAGPSGVLSVCRAPSCGMLFLRRGARQRWCCDGCGNRSRVARHAQRRRQPRG